MSADHPLYRLTNDGLFLCISTLVKRTKEEYGGVLQDAIADIFFAGNSTEAFHLVNDFIEAAERIGISLEGITTYNEKELVATFFIMAINNYNGNLRQTIEECVDADWTPELLTDEVNRFLEIAVKFDISTEGILV